MSADVDRIVREVTALPEVERLEVVSRLLDEQDDESLSEYWRIETRRRLELSKAGKTERQPFSELKKSIAKKYGHTQKN